MKDVGREIFSVMCSQGLKKLTPEATSITLCILNQRHFCMKLQLLKINLDGTRFGNSVPFLDNDLVVCNEMPGG